MVKVESPGEATRKVQTVIMFLWKSDRTSTTHFCGANHHMKQEEKTLQTEARKCWAPKRYILKIIFHVLY